MSYEARYLQYINLPRIPQELLDEVPEDLGNFFGTVFVALPVGIENPLERAYKIKHDMIALKQSLQPALSSRRHARHHQLAGVTSPGAAAYEYRSLQVPVT